MRVGRDHYHATLRKNRTLDKAQATDNAVSSRVLGWRVFYGNVLFERDSRGEPSDAHLLGDASALKYLVGGHEPRQLHRDFGIRHAVSIVEGFCLHLPVIKVGMEYSSEKVVVSGDFCMFRNHTPSLQSTTDGSEYLTLRHVPGFT